jgi:hypothetical protein
MPWRAQYLVLTLTLLGAGSMSTSCVQPTAGQSKSVSCDVVLCRKPGTIPMQLENGEPSPIEISEPEPFVIDDVVTVLPGDTLFIEADMEGGHLKNLRAVPEVRDPARTLTLEFSKPGEMTMLKITNGFPQVVKLHALMRIPGHDGWHKTSTCPIGPDGFFDMESWPHQISGLMLQDFRLLGSAIEKAGPCVY